MLLFNTLESKSYLKEPAPAKAVKQVITRSEYCNHLNAELFWYSTGRFVFGCQMVRYLKCGLKTILKKPDYGPKCPVFK